MSLVQYAVYQATGIALPGDGSQPAGVGTVIPPSGSTPAQWASKGTGPRYAKFGRHVRYHLSDVIDWERGSKPATYGLSVPSAVDAGGGLQTRTGTRR